MKFFSTIFVTILILATYSCKTSNKMFDPKTTKQTVISFGTGGGFTGNVTEYHLSSTGKIYTELESGIKEVGKIKKQIADQIFANYKNLKLNELELDDPGNRYYFVRHKSGDNVHQLQWGKQPLENTNLQTYFNILMAEVKRINDDKK